MEEKTTHPHDGIDYLMPGEEDDYEDEVIESEDDLMQADVDVDKMKELPKKTKSYKYALDDLNRDWLKQQHHLDNYLRGPTRKKFYPYSNYSNSGPNA